MSSIKVETFALQIQISVDRLIKQLAEAGITNKLATDEIKAHEKR